MSKINTIAYMAAAAMMATQGYDIPPSPRREPPQPHFNNRKKCKSCKLFSACERCHGRPDWNICGEYKKRK